MPGYRIFIEHFLYARNCAIAVYYDRNSKITLQFPNGYELYNAYLVEFVRLKR